MMKPRGMFLLEAIICVAAVVLLFATLAGSITLVSHNLVESTRKEQLSQERNAISELLSDDVRMSQTIEWAPIKSKKTGALQGSKLRLTQSDGSVIEYAFEQREYTISPSQSATPTLPRRSRRDPTPNAVPLVAQTIEEPPTLIRTVSINDVQKSSRRWNYYLLKKLECSGQSGLESAWDLNELKIGTKLDARTGHVFVLMTLEFFPPGKSPLEFSAGATTRIEPAPKTEKQP
jgi:hypothetical protein